ncbi:uncharacterized protein LOC103006588 isoform X1 [Balaenoptera acutorostrata]|uniref:Uncharacterized protein LOC103006588 isoform X1 n=1 Tax=Balaenoptera acutorostrata TaxID=9767 RepID=A0ABM3T8N7_BALAC|nr:uncharacterized protein LOC103006588 isoform X1 [Balaenoptera acutorostrata]
MEVKPAPEPCSLQDPDSWTGHHACRQRHPLGVSSGGGDLGGIRSRGGGRRAAHLLSCRQGPSGSDCCAVCFFGWREPGRAVVSDTAATQPAPPLSAFLPVVIGLDRQAAVLHPLGPRSTGRKLLGAAWGLLFRLAWKNHRHIRKIISTKNVGEEKKKMLVSW